MTRHPLDTEPTTARDYDADHARNDAMRDLPVARTYLIPPLAAYDIHAKLVAAIREWEGHATRGSVGAKPYVMGLREAYFVVFGETAP